MKKHRKLLWTLVVVVILLAGTYLWLDNASYPAGATAQAVMVSDASVSVTVDGTLTVFAPANPRRGFIFYPGGFVSHTAYAPLMRALAEDGWLCVLAEMPFDLAVLGMNAAEGIPARFPEITSWAIGGHSLGGAMAASHAAKHPGVYDTLVLLAAYSTEDISGSCMRVFSLYGENDGVLNMEKYAQERGHLPEDTVEIVIPGGNHALFGDYGHQKGDGDADIAMEEQIKFVVEAIR